MKREQHGSVQVVTLDEASTVLNADTVAAWNDTLDGVTATPGQTALVVTGSGKSFHQGLDLPFLLELGDRSAAFLKTIHQLFGRLLRLDVPTVAAINGHAQAGGAMLACCFDLRIMRADRGWFRLPEVALNLPFTTVMNDLLLARLPQPARHRLMVLGTPIGGVEAAATGVVDVAVEGEDGPLAAAIEQAEALAAFRGPVIRTIRTAAYADLLRSIDADVSRDDLFA
ncbi:MAG TPA: enoyl-CoA hydratase/isomerase family protein [Euzebya sp.]|nr:enoyl-CoA hydratase/isomerase family protein [Euzebya sp.]